jgi:hypothetical protein
MVCNTLNYWGFGLCPSSLILEIRKHSVSETGCVFILRWRGRKPTLFGPLERANLNHWFFVFILLYLILVSVHILQLLQVAAWSIRCCRQRTCIHLQRSLVLLLLPGVLLAAVGLILFAFIETEANYQVCYMTIAVKLLIQFSREAGK